MKLIRPDAEMLRAYVYEELPEEEAAGVRRWLVACSDERVLSAYEELLEERRRNERVLEHWSARPVLAQLEWFWARLRRRARPHGEAWISSGLTRPAELAALGSSTATGAKPVIEVLPGETVDLEIHLAVACYVGAYALESKGTLALLADPARRAEAGTKLNLSGISLEPDEGELEVFIVFDTASPLPQPAPDSGADWLVALLGSVEPNPERSAVRRTLRLAGTPASGKQT
jgi:hypothetical protein